jgi:ABC-type antimicrobial peptide transport system permease subunit
MISKAQFGGVLIAVGLIVGIGMTLLLFTADLDMPAGRYPGTLAFWLPIGISISAIAVVAGVITALRARKR